MPYDDDPAKRNAYMREYRERKTSTDFEPQRPGRKPLNLASLCAWEFTWYKAFHSLRDGTVLPPCPDYVAADQRAIEDELRWWKTASRKEILGEDPDTPPPFDELPESERKKAQERWETREGRLLRQFAEHQREAEIMALERWLEPRETPERAERRKNWETLADPRASMKAIHNVCEEWKLLPDVQARGLSIFADHVLAKVEEFRRMKHNKRYPGPGADDSRIDYLARGMAGLMVGASPITSVQRLRLMRHGPGGPLWIGERTQFDKKRKYTVPGFCRCWRCYLKRSRTWNSTRTLQEVGRV